MVDLQPLVYYYVVALGSEKLVEDFADGSAVDVVDVFAADVVLDDSYKILLIA